jgi:hypothetical protein
VIKCKVIVEKHNGTGQGTNIDTRRSRATVVVIVDEVPLTVGMCRAREDARTTGSALPSRLARFKVWLRSTCGVHRVSGLGLGGMGMALESLRGQAAGRIPASRIPNCLLHDTKHVNLYHHVAIMQKQLRFKSDIGSMSSPHAEEHHQPYKERKPLRIK